MLQGAQELVAGVWLLVGTWEFEVAAAVEEGGRGVGRDLPTVEGDFDNFAVGVGEIEEDGVRVVGIATGGDVAFDGEAGATAVGPGGERADGLAEGVGTGRLVVIAIEAGDKPVANARRVN